MVPSIPVHLVAYDPLWAEVAAVHKSRLEQTGLFLSTHHIGSTSVPGLVAKPVVDLIGLVEDVDAFDTQSDALKHMGYKAYGEFGVPGRRFFTLDDSQTGARVINLHCYIRGAESAELQMAFRDYLRAHPDMAAAYAEEKRKAMALHPDNSTLYAEKKGPFIRAALEKALAWVGERSAA